MLYETNSETETLLEKTSRTTGENIVFSQEILKEAGIVPNELVIIGRKSQLYKLRIIAWRIWDLGSPTIRFVPGIDTTPLWYKLLDSLIMPFVNLIDPKDMFFLHFFKKLCRNT